MPTWDDVLAVAQRLPGVEVGSSYGTPSLKVRNKLICRLRTKPDALVVRVIDMEDREALADGRRRRVLHHAALQGVPVVLVRMEAIDAGELGELVEDAWRLQAPKRLVAELDGGRG